MCLALECFPSADLKAPFLAVSSRSLLWLSLHKLSVSETILFIKYTSHVPWPREVRCAIWIVLANEITLVRAKLRQQKTHERSCSVSLLCLEDNNFPDGGAPVSLCS